MKRIFYLSSLFLIFIACNNKDSQSVVKIEKKESLKYYKCDYSKRFDTLQFSGGENSTFNEVWGFNKKDLNKLPNKSLSQINLNEIINVASTHLKKRFPNIILDFSSLTLKKINEKDTTNLNNYFFDVSFIYDKKGYYQEIPILLDGTIILSNNE